MIYDLINNKFVKKRLSPSLSLKLHNGQGCSRNTLHQVRELEPLGYQISYRISYHRISLCESRDSTLQQAMVVSYQIFTYSPLKIIFPPHSRLCNIFRWQRVIKDRKNQSIQFVLYLKM
jgi:hypothetical protein